MSDEIKVIARKDDDHRLVAVGSVLFLTFKDGFGLPSRKQVTSPEDMPGWASDEEVLEALKFLEKHKGP